jgi:hypothetical protein
MKHQLDAPLDGLNHIMRKRQQHKKRAAVVIVSAIMVGACTSGSTGPDQAQTISAPPTPNITEAPGPDYFSPVGWALSTPVTDLSSRGSLADTVTVGDTVVMVGSFQTGGDGLDRNATMWLATPTNLSRVTGDPFGQLKASVESVDAIRASDPSTAQLIAVGSTGDDDGIRGAIWELSASDLVGNPKWVPVYSTATGIRFVDVVTVGRDAIAVGTERVAGQRKPVFMQRNKLTGEWKPVELASIPDGDVSIAGLTAGELYVAAAGTITEQGRSRPVVWISRDAGLSWRLEDLPADDANTRVSTVGFGAGHYLITGSNGRGEGVIWSSDTALRWNAEPALIGGERVQGLSFGFMTSVSIQTDSTGQSQNAVAIGAAQQGDFPAWIYWTPTGEQFSISGGYPADIEELIPSGPPQLIDTGNGFWTVYGVAGGFVIIQPGGTRGGPGGSLPLAGPETYFERAAVTDRSFLITGQTRPVRTGNTRGPKANLYGLVAGEISAEVLELDDKVSRISDVVPDGDGGFVVIGLARSDDYLNNLWVARLDNQGRTVNTVTRGEAGVQIAERVFKLGGSWTTVGYSYPDGEPFNSQARVWISNDLISWTDALTPDTTSGSKLTGGCLLADERLVVFGGIRSDDLTNRPAAWMLDDDTWTVIDLGIETGNLNACAANSAGVTILGSDGTNNVVLSGDTGSLSVTVFDANQQPYLMAQHGDVQYLIGRTWVGDWWRPAVWVGVNGDWQPILAPSIETLTSWTINDVVFDANGDMVLFGQIGLTPAMWVGVK